MGFCLLEVIIQPCLFLYFILFIDSYLFFFCCWLEDFGGGRLGIFVSWRYLFSPTFSCILYYLLILIYSFFLCWLEDFGGGRLSTFVSWRYLFSPAFSCILFYLLILIYFIFFCWLEDLVGGILVFLLVGGIYSALPYPLFYLLFFTYLILINFFFFFFDWGFVWASLHIFVVSFTLPNRWSVFARKIKLEIWYDTNHQSFKGKMSALKISFWTQDTFIWIWKETTSISASSNLTGRESLKIKPDFFCHNVFGPFFF